MTFAKIVAKIVTKSLYCIDTVVDTQVQQVATVQTLCKCPR